MKKYQSFFIRCFFKFLKVKFSIYLNWRVFVMILYLDSLACASNEID